MSRAMLVFAHQDDEVVALGGRLTRLRDAYLVHVTDGAPADNRDAEANGFDSREAYRHAREDELSEVLSSAGLTNVRRECLGYVDQSASFHLAELTRKIEERVAAWLPEVMFTHPYEGGHPDHDACAFAVHHAVHRRARDGACAPLIIEALFYHLRNGSICTDEFLSGTHSALEREYVLSPSERERKRDLFACFRTQQRTLQQFSIEYERYRVGPQYNFTQPPHMPPVFYDHFPWGMTSDRFCHLAGEAEILLAKDERPA